LIDLAMLELEEGKVVWEYYKGLKDEPCVEGDDPEEESDEEGDEMEMEVDSGSLDVKDSEVEVKSVSSEGVTAERGQI
jgi:hypothetical protein